MIGGTLMKKTYHRWRDLRERKLSPTQLEHLDRDAEQQRFLDGLVEDFAALRNNPAAWQEEQVERTAWECTLADGLEGE